MYLGKVRSYQSRCWWPWSFVFSSVAVAGTVDFATSEGDHLVITPDSREVQHAYPLYGSIQNYP